MANYYMIVFIGINEASVLLWNENPYKMDPARGWNNKQANILSVFVVEGGSPWIFSFSFSLCCLLVLVRLGGIVTRYCINVEPVERRRVEEFDG